MIIIDNRQLKYFLAIAEERNITKAAERLHIVQPYLSLQLKNLEEELGVKLIIRSTRKIQITDAGKNLQFRAKQMIDLMEIENALFLESPIGVNIYKNRAIILRIKSFI